MKIVKKLKKRHAKLKRKIRKVLCRIKKVFGKKCKSPHKKKLGDHQLAEIPHEGAVVRPRIGRLPGWVQEQKEKMEQDTLYGLAVSAGFEGPRCAFESMTSTSPSDRFPILKLKKAIERIRAVNKKLQAFEKGFISEDGIPDREWFKHLGVAPGLWLGRFLSVFLSFFRLTVRTRIRRHRTSSANRVNHLREECNTGSV